MARRCVIGKLKRDAAGANEGIKLFAARERLRRGQGIRVISGAQFKRLARSAIKAEAESGPVASGSPSLVIHDARPYSHRMDVVRTAESRFDNLPGYPFAPTTSTSRLRTRTRSGCATSTGPARQAARRTPPRRADLELPLPHGDPAAGRSGAPGAGARPDRVRQSDKPTRMEDYTYLRRVGWVTDLLESLDLDPILGKADKPLIEHVPARRASRTTGSAPATSSRRTPVPSSRSACSTGSESGRGVGRRGPSKNWAALTSSDSA